MNLRRLLPERVEPANRAAFVRHGVAEVLESWVGLSSLGTMTADWRMRSVWMSETKTDLKKLLEHPPKPYKTWRSGRLDRAEFMVMSAVYLAQGVLEVGSGGGLTSSWGLIWTLNTSDDVFGWIAKRLRIDR